MRTQTFASFARQATAAVSRRASLLTLGGAALAATAARPDMSAAKKKKSGANCKKKEKKRCSNDAAACRNTIATYCAGGNCDPASALALQACCDTCSANGFITCQLALVP